MYLLQIARRLVMGVSFSQPLCHCILKDKLSGYCMHEQAHGEGALLSIGRPTHAVMRVAS